MLSLLLTLCSCSLPDIAIDKQPKRASVQGVSFFEKHDDHTGAGQSSGRNNYLATVHLRFTETGAPVNFDIRRSRDDFISFNMQESQTTSTSMHLGYSRGEGGMAGLRFSWHF
jgi:hypothetical protein